MTADELEILIGDLQEHCQQFLLASQGEFDGLRGQRLDALDARELVFLDVRIRVEALLRRIDMWTVAPNGRGRTDTVALSRNAGSGRPFLEV